MAADFSLRKTKKIMSIKRKTVQKYKVKAFIDEFLAKELQHAGYGNVDILETPMGTYVTIHAMRTGAVVGHAGENIKALARTLEEKFKLERPQISVTEIEVPELNPYVMASRIASALERGIHFRKVGFWALSNIMRAGALGAEIIISGKLVSERARYETYRAGFLPKSGEPSKFLRKAAVQAKLKVGIFGVKVTIMPPIDLSLLPDKISVEKRQKTEEAEKAKGES